METLRTGGEIIESAAFGQPGQDGVTIYLDAPGGVDGVLTKVPKAGGQIVVPKTAIGENGFYAIILDTEGNRIGLHSMQKLERRARRKDSTLRMNRSVAQTSRLRV